MAVTNNPEGIWAEEYWPERDIAVAAKDKNVLMWSGRRVKRRKIQHEQAGTFDYWRDMAWRLLSYAED